MKIGIPTEVKPAERRVALTPQACAELVAAGHHVYLQKGAGQAAGYDDASYVEAGVTLAADASELYRQAELVVKVKEPLAEDLALLRPEQTLFCYLHLAGVEGLAESLQQIGLTAYAFETVVVDGKTPLLAPMSAIAGRVAVQLASRLLHAQQGGRGVLLGGISGHSSGLVTVIGAGIAGQEAAILAAGMGAEVHLLDLNPDRLKQVKQAHPAIHTHLSTPEQLTELLPQTDVLVGAVYLIGQRAPIVASASQLALLPKGAVVVDIAIDQGGCFEASTITSHNSPAVEHSGVWFSGIPNLPAAVPHTASAALSAAILPYVQQLAAGLPSQALAAAVNVRAGEVVLK